MTFSRTLGASVRTRTTYQGHSTRVTATAPTEGGLAGSDKHAPLSITVEHTVACRHEPPQPDNVSTTSLTEQNDSQRSTTWRLNSLGKNPSCQGSSRQVIQTTNIGNDKREIEKGNANITALGAYAFADYNTVLNIRIIGF